MRDLPVEHYLGIYETRLGMIAKGVTHPTPQVIAGVKQLVAALRSLRPDEKIRLDATDERAIFTRAATGDLVARIDYR